MTKPRTLQYRLLIGIAVITIFSGLTQVVAPRFVLGMIGADTAPASRHFFAIIGMFMALFGGALFQALRSPAHHPIVLFWASLQKFGASIAVTLGVFNGIFSSLALGVAGFDLLSGLIGLAYWLRVREGAPVPRERPGEAAARPALPEKPVRPHGAPREGEPAPKRSLILAGGGMRVSYQAGVIRALFEAGLSFNHADGTSGGIINLAMLLSGLSPKEMCDRWRTLNIKDFVSFLPFENYLKATDLPAMGDADGIREAVFPHLGIDLKKINAVRGMAGTFNVCNYTRKTNDVIPHDRVDLDLLIAGISLPIFMPPVPKGEALFIDSVWIKDANLIEAVKRGAEELWVVWCIGNGDRYKNGAFHQYVHMIEMSANGVLHEEFDRIKEINARIERGEAVYGQARPIRLHLIRPDYPLPLDPDLYFGKIDAATLIDMGYADAKKYLSGMSPEGLPFHPEVTKMSDSQLGITFRETMAGPFALGESDPQAGEKKGKAEGTFLSMHATINIRDLKKFTSDPGHPGEIAGHIDFAPFGEKVPASVGVFNLFSPTDRPKLKLMIYELGFEHAGGSYYLAGKKEVQDDPGFDLWKDTTRLLTRLHKGKDKSGPVIGAGILTLDAGELMKLLSTFRATNAKSAREEIEAVAGFGRFFLGELWNAYKR